MIKIQHLITKEQKELFVNLTERFAKKINDFLSNNNQLIDKYQEKENLKYLLNEVISLPVDLHSIETSFVNFKIFDNSFSFQGHGKLQVFNYLDEKQINTQYTFFDFYFKVEKTSISYTLRARNFPGLEYISWKDKIKKLSFEKEIADFFIYTQNIKKLNESTKHKTGS